MRHSIEQLQQWQASLKTPNRIKLTEYKNENNV